MIAIGMLRTLTLLGFVFLLVPVVVVAVVLTTGFRLTENWDALMFVAWWGFLLGVPSAAGPAAWVARRRCAQGLFRTNVAILVIWATALVATLFIHF